MRGIVEREREQFSEQRRLAYRVAGALGVILILIDVLSIASDPQLDGLTRAIYALNDALLATIAVVVIWLLAARRFALGQIERLMFALFAAESLLFNGLVPALLGQTLAMRLSETVGDDIWFLLMICTLGFQLFAQRSGLLIGGGIYLLSAGIVGLQTLYRSGLGEPAGPGLQALQVYLMGATLLCFTYIVARYREQAQRLSVEVELVARLAYLDALTELPNRRRLEEQLNEVLARARRHEEPLAICMWDLDHFKRINDSRGHEVGDAALRAVAERVRGLLRAGDTFGRWGGEEFLLLLERTDSAEALVVVSRVRQALAERPLLDGLTVTASFGMACHQPGESAERLLARADAALYVAKAAGRDQIQTG